MSSNKIISFTDIHYGLKRNSIEHNKDCDSFIDWVIDTAKEQGITECAFLGDWHHNRHTINVETLKYSFDGMHKLNKYFSKVYFIVGNHDLYYRETREINSLVMAEGLHNFVVIDKPTTAGDMLFLPWLVQDEWKEVKKMKAKYIFGHFELPTFLLNSMISMPDHKELNADDFPSDSYVFSGHFHKRQNKNNVWYIGNAFPHTFDDTNDDERGCMILDRDTSTISFEAWEDAPKYRKYVFDDIKGNEASMFEGVSKIHAKIFYNSSTNTPIQMNIYREELKEKYDFRVIDLIDQATTRVVETTEDGTIINESVEQSDETQLELIEDVNSATIKQLSKLESDEYEVPLLIQLYREL